MRLTLRTLLAYLDDILEPEQAREIGKKVQTAPVAQELVTRIRDVVRRRRLKAPTLEGPEAGLDPNIVAEYLDNQLTPPQVAQTERVLLNSEMHLAEAASAHQILTLVLGEPVEVLPESRRRMYALGPVRKDEQLAVEEPQVEESSAPETVVSPPEHREAVAQNATDTGVSLSDYVKEGRTGRRWWPLVGVTSLVGLFALLHFTEGTSAPDKPDAGENLAASAPASDDTKIEDVVAADAGDPVVGQPDAGGTDASEPVVAADTNKQPDAEPIIAASEPPTAPATIDAPEPADAPEPTDAAPDANPAMATDVAATDPADTSDVKVAGVEPIAKPDVMDVAPPTKPDVADVGAPVPSAPVPDNGGMVPPPAVVQPKSVPRLQFTSKSGVLLRFMADEGWKMVPPGDSIADGDRIASPRPYVAEFTAGDLPLSFHVGAGSRMQLFASATADLGIRLGTGHVVVSRSATEGEDNADGEPKTVEIMAGDKSWTVTIPPGESRIAFDATPVPPVRLDTKYEGFAYKVWAVGSQGTLEVKSADGSVKAVGSEDRIALAGPGPGQVLVEPGAESDWLVGKDPVAKWIAGPTAPTDKRDAIKFAAEFDPGDPISATMPALIKHDRSWMSRRAVQCLALTGDYQAMIRALSIAEHDEPIAEAIQGLRAWLPTDEDNGAKLREALEMEFTVEDSDILYQLLWGFDETHAKDNKTSRELVRWLSHDRSAVQRLAYFHILRITGSQDEYRTSLSKDRLSSFRKRWERQIDKYGTLLKD